jgi:Right handed beta helix region
MFVDPTSLTAVPVAGAAVALASASAAHQIFVSPRGNDANTGASSWKPLKHIQRALDRARPGTTIHLAAGIYTEQLRTKVAGRAGAPIRIVGPESGRSATTRYQAVLRYSSGAMIVVNHSHYLISGFTVDGQPGISRKSYPSKDNFPSDSFKNSVQRRAVDTKLIVIGQNPLLAGVHDVTISSMLLSGAGGECVRIRNGAYQNVVEKSLIQWCGMFRKVEPSTYAYHNGEGVYIGTSPKSLPYTSDWSWGNVVRNNVINTHGSECFDVKENSSGNTFQGNTCAYNDEPPAFGGSNVELRGTHNIVKGNTISFSRGWNVKVRSDPLYQNVGNAVSGNTLSSAFVGPYTM